MITTSFSTPPNKKGGHFNRMLMSLERAGNKLPDPITLFICLAFLVVIISAICSLADVSAVHPGTGDTLKATNLLSVSGARRIWSEAVNNFKNFAPLSIVLLAVIGSGAAEKSGFLSILMRKILTEAPPLFVTASIIFIGIIMNLAGDAGFVILPPLAAIIFLGINRHPLLGLFAGYAGVAAGFCANVIINIADAVAYGFTEQAARFIDPNYQASPAINFYFLFVSAVLLTITGTIVTEKIMAPRFEGQDLSKYEADDKAIELTPEQNRGLKAAGISFLITLLVIFLMCVGPNPILADPATGSLLVASSAFMSGIMLTVSLLLFVPGSVFGFFSGKYKNDKDLFADIANAFRDMGPYILLCFFCAQFTSYFNWSNLGAILAIKGAGLLTMIKLPPAALLVGIVLISCILNLFIGSASAKWAILAPIFVPMMMLLGLDPAITQVAYRIGDSITNPISPLFSYFPLILGFVRRYEKDAGMGTVIANMLPYSIWFAIAWVLQLILWVLLNLPVGPGGAISLH